jgi:integrase
MRTQKGSLLLQHGSWHVRFYQDGKRKSLRIAPEGTDKKKIRQLAATLMLEVNSGKVEAIDSRRPEVMVFDFWTETFLPWATDNLRPSSVHGYKKLWDGVLKVHFAGRSIEGYKTCHGSEFLSGLAPRMTRNSLSHVRSLSSSVFGHAVNRGIIDRNPWREVRLLAKPKPSKPTTHYTMEEAKENLRLLAGDAKAQACFGLSFFLALRPGELSALKWEDFDLSRDIVAVRRSAWRGLVGQTKTATESLVPLIPPAKELFERYALDRYEANVKAGMSPPTLRGWLFPNPSGAKPLDMSAYSNRVLRRILKARYKGLYSARRGMATALVEMTGNVVSAQGMLRHANMTVKYPGHSQTMCLPSTLSRSTTSSLLAPSL